MDHAPRAEKYVQVDEPQVLLALRLSAPILFFFYVTDALSTLAANDSPMGQETASPQPHSTSSPAPTLAPPVRPQAESGSSSPAPALAPAPAPGPAPGPPPVLPARLDALTAGPPRPIYNGPPPGFGPPGPPPSAPSTLSSVAQNMSPAALGSPQDAFKHLLRTTGVTLAWTWEQTMRQIVTEPLYKALKSLAERKAVFADYQSDLRKEEEEARAQKRLAVKPQVVDLLKSAVGGAGKLQPYSSWKTVMKLYGSDRALKDAVDAVGENEVAPFWDEVKKDLKASEEVSLLTCWYQPKSNDIDPRPSHPHPALCARGQTPQHGSSHVPSPNLRSRREHSMARCTSHCA